MEYKKPSLFFYKLTQVLSWVVAKTRFKRKFKRNEIKGKKGPFVVIANHQAAWDFVCLIGATRERMHFVISNSFYNSLSSLKGIMNKVGVIPKQQFQTSLKDLARMKSVLDNGAPLVLYPAGLMTEDGLSTPVPCATYKFLKWLGVDVYAARTYGTYFVTPKWSGKKRPGRTYLDIYKLFDKEELHELDESEIKARADEVLLFNAYRENEELQLKYKCGNNILGLENVLYECPHCKSEFSVKTKDKSIIYCEKCGFAHESDKYGFLHNIGEVGEEIRYPSDWSRMIYGELKDKLESEAITSLSANVRIKMIDAENKKIADVGEGKLTLDSKCFTIEGIIKGEEKEITVPIQNFPSLPFSPGNYFEIQHGETIYRCLPEDGASVMKFINMVKIFYELNMENTNQCPDAEHRLMK